jgi:uncharacterized protein
MTKLFKSLAALLLLFTGPVAAQQSHGLVEVPSSGQVLKPALWQVSDADTTIFLFGTIHALPSGLNWLQGPVAAALDSSDELVTEIPEAKPEEVQALVLRNAVLPAGQTLKSLLPPEEHQATTAALTALGLPAPAFERFKPWYVALVLTTLPLQQQGYAVDNGVEGALAARIQAAGKPRLALETLEFQLGIFDNQSLADQRKMLAETVAGQGEMRAQLDQLVKEWGEGDATTLAQLLNDEAGDPAAREVIFIGRNRNWVQWLTQRLNRPGQSFVAVGAGHLAGKDSVIDLLEKQGLTVVRVQ